MPRVEREVSVIRAINHHDRVAALWLWWRRIFLPAVWKHIGGYRRPLIAHDLNDTALPAALLISQSCKAQSQSAPGRRAAVAVPLVIRCC